jgi:hypothetical protein
MIAVLYRCPATGLTVDEWVADTRDVATESNREAIYDAVTCRACNHIHLVDLSTGKVLAVATREATR